MKNDVERLIQLISKMRAQWVHSWAKDECFQALKDYGRESKAKLDISSGKVDENGEMVPHDKTHLRLINSKD